MAESTTKKNSAPDSSREESYRMAKLLTVRFGLLTSKELEQLRSLTKEIFVTVKFPAPEGESADGGLVTGEFHISDEPAPTVTTVNGVTMYGGVELVMLQK